MGVSVNYGNILSEIQMDQDEIDYMVDLISALPANALMVEWGAGGSTCKWLSTLTETQKLITIEHNDIWYNKVVSASKVHFGDVSERFTCMHYPEENEFKHVYGSINEEHPTGLKHYFNPEVVNFFNADIFFIDGVARATCALIVLLKHTKSNPAIFIHDYYGREQWYAWITQFFTVSKVGSTLARLHPKQHNNRGLH